MTKVRQQNYVVFELYYYYYYYGTECMTDFDLKDLFYSYHNEELSGYIGSHRILFYNSVIIIASHDEFHYIILVGWEEW